MKINGPCPLSQSLESSRLPFQIFPLHPRTGQLLQCPKSGQTAPDRRASASFSLACLTSLTSLISRLIGQALADDTTQERVCTSHIGVSPAHSFIVSEIELGKISVKVVLLHVMIGSIDAAFEDSKIALYSVGVNIPAHIFLFAMFDNIVTAKFVSQSTIYVKIVGNYPCFLVHLVPYNAFKVQACHFSGDPTKNRL